MSSYYSWLKKISYSFLFLLLLGNSIQVQGAQGKLYKGMNAIPFTLRDLNGDSKSLSQLSAKEKLTAIVFWSVWNEQSSNELIRLQKTYEIYHPHGFQVIAINVEDQNISKRQTKHIAKYCKEKSITFPVMIDHNLETFHQYSIIAVPTTFLINEDKTIIYRLPGYPITGAEELFSTIKDFMKPFSGEGSSDRTRLRIPDEKALRYYQMAKVLQENGDYSGAIESLRKSIDIDPDFLPPYNRLGSILYEEGKPGEAAEVFNRALSKDPDDLPFLADYGNFLIQTGESEKGLSTIRMVLNKDPNYAMGHYYLGNYLLKKGKKEESLKEAQKAVKLNPLDFNGHRLLGSVYESMDKKKKSLAAYKKAAILLEKRVKSQDLFLDLSF
jgi:Tfp pilus assembly protein PilF/peroxiredoxin